MTFYGEPDSNQPFELISSGWKVIHRANMGGNSWIGAT
jgi:hypothetical protein